MLAWAYSGAHGSVSRFRHAEFLRNFAQVAVGRLKRVRPVTVLPSTAIGAASHYRNLVRAAATAMAHGRSIRMAQ